MELRAESTAQTIFSNKHNGGETLTLPPANSYVMKDIQWGRAGVLFTPSYWVCQSWLYSFGNGTGSRHFRIGDSLKEEIAVCVLCGHGIRAEVGVAAFEKLRSRGMFNESHPDEQDIVDMLLEPLQVNGNRNRYRFPRQRAKYLAAILKSPLLREPQPEDDMLFRNWIMQLPGVGPKTASWITRNWRGSNSVAIIDVHIYRAGAIMGLFEWGLPIVREYVRLEELFLAFAGAIGVRPSLLDEVMWSQMRGAGRQAIRALAKATGDA